jgi:pimeloyl-ACP methyl ester carboxylesterase
MQALQAVSTLRAALLPLAIVAVLAAPRSALAADLPAGLKPCHLSGLEHDAWCGVLKRPLNPAEPQGRQIDLHYAVVPALARNKKPDPVFFFAGGPGQSAMTLAGNVSRLMARLSNRRDLVLIDQRGTGRSAPLACDDDAPTRPLADAADPERQLALMRDCRNALQRLPHGDLRRYTSTIAMQDADAVRQALGVAQINLVGASYGTRAALEYMRQFPQAVRRVVIDGVAPPDMVLPASFSTDGQQALEQVLAACEADATCRANYPALRADWQALLRSLPRTLMLTHPVTGQPEAVVVSRDMLLGMTRAPLYAPALAAALPLAITEGARGRLEPLLGLANALTRGRSAGLAAGMHYAVVCAEDVPRLAQAADAPGADFGHASAEQYAKVCADWPRGEVPAAFYSLPTAPVATLLLSGGADPATPPRHAERVRTALGAKARHVVVPQAGHGVMAIGCMRDVVFRFIDAASDDDALKVDADCARAIPRPGVFVPVAASSAVGAKP